MTPLAEEIRLWLLTQPDWVSEEAICRRFNVNERLLRSTNKTPGLCSRFAISGNKGFKHIRNATPDERERFFSRVKSHAVGELLRLKELREELRNELTGPRYYPFEIATGQGLILP